MEQADEGIHRKKHRNKVLAIQKSILQLNHSVNIQGFFIASVSYLPDNQLKSIYGSQVANNMNALGNYL